VNAHLQDGRNVRISTDPHKWTPEMPPLTACVRGFGALERVYQPERLLHPLRRTGSRGANQWERITWADALDEVARQMRRVRET
jgi:anaerobic selenocysteine-containing dehydrogenase